jgi:isopenicillin N synthase-like dioxygenase
LISRVSPDTDYLKNGVFLLIYVLAFYGTDEQAKDGLIRQIGEACKQSGFFTLINHGIPESLQKELLACSEEFFSLPLNTKETYNKG